MPAVACGPAEALTQEPEPLQLFLECGRENAEGDRCSFLVSARGQERRDDEAPLETGQKVSKHQAVARYFDFGSRIDRRPFRKVARHAWPGSDRREKYAMEAQLIPP